MFSSSRKKQLPIACGRRRFSVTTAALVLAVSVASGCSSHGSNPDPSATAQARSLSQEELEAARLADGEAGSFGVGLGDETPADMEWAVTTVTPEVCLPAMKLILHGWAEGAVGYTRYYLSDPKNTVGTKSVALTTYPAGRAEQALASVEKSLRRCPAVLYEVPALDPVHAKLSLGKKLEFGDESLKVSMNFSMDGIENHTVYAFVRIGDVLAWFNVNQSFGDTLPERRKKDLMPTLPEDLISRQVEKIEAAFAASSTP